MTTSITRADLALLQGITPKLLRFFEETFGTVLNTAQAVDGQIASTSSIQSATVVTLSPNAAFDNERVLTQGSGISLTVTDDTVTIATDGDIATNGGFRLTFNLVADTNLDLPSEGTVATTIAPGIYANDAAAAADGVGVNESYRKTGGTLAYRVS